ncbi:SbcC/MukB-like Walker B domain-containing protein, partial [Brachybacterium hainanense]
LDQLASRLRDGEAAAGQARMRLDADSAAQPVATAIARRDRALAAADEAARTLAQLREKHADAPDLLALEGRGDALDALQDRIREEAVRAGELGALVELETGLTGRRDALSRTAEELDRRQADLTRLTAEIDARPAEREVLQVQRQEAQTAAAGLADARLALEAAQQKLAHARSAQKLAAVAQTAREQVAAALSASQNAIDAEQDLRRRRNQGLAAELALSLSRGEECPVCGATEHPHPAEPGAGHVDADAVDAAERARQDKDAALGSAREALSVATSRYEAAAEQAGGLDPEAALAAQRTAKARVAALQEQLARAAALETQIEEHDERSRALASRKEELALALGTAQTALAEQTTALDADAARVDEARGPAGSVAERRRAHQRAGRAAQQLREAHLAADQAAARARELAAEVALGDFSGDDAVRAALLPPQARGELEALLQTRRTEQARLEDGLAEDGIRETDPGDQARAAAEVAGTTAREQLARAEDAAAAAERTAGHLSSVASASERALTRLREAVARVRAVSEEAATVVRVADLATGRSADGRRIQLSTYVLMRRFEDVIAAANTRLALFSSSDLELMRDDSARGARKTGLDLMVIDRRTDQARVPETLSGGETFIVSLALALGLADIVTAEAGGVAMETLFIDEGFGSLDPESLDRVVAEIGQLAAHGRTIGLVSHVGEMKQQIREQIHVRRREDGSSTATCTA